MKKMRLKREFAILLVVMIIVSMFQGVNGTVKVAQAAENGVMTDAQFLDLSSTALEDKAEAFSDYNLIGTDKVARIRFGKNGENAREWLVAGADGVDALALLSTTSFGTSQYGTDSIYGDDEDSSKTSTVLNHLKLCMSGTTYFSAAEKSKDIMKDTTVETTDYNGKERSVTEQLYLPDAANRESSSKKSIYIGTGDTKKEISLPNLRANGCTSNQFWLRSPHSNDSYGALYVGFTSSSSFVDYTSIIVDMSVLPAFDLNLSSAVFASSAVAATSVDDGTGKALTTTDKTYTLRYTPGNTIASGSDLTSASAEVNMAGNEVAMTNVKTGMYLVVQSSEGAYEVPVSDATTPISASDITIDGTKLTSFDNCKVWLETTKDNLTYAKLATKEIVNVTVTNPEDSHILRSSAEGNGTDYQTNITGAMQDIVYKAAENYYFPEDYVSTITELTDGTLHGVTVTRDSDSQITVSGTPTVASTTISLRPATKRTYAVNQGETANGTFFVNKAAAAKDDTVTISPSPASGYATNTVTVTDADSGDVTVNNENGTYTFIMPAKSVTVKVTFKAKEETPVIYIDYGNEKLTGFVNGANYTIDGNDVLPVDGFLAVEDYMGREISIVRKASVGKADSDAKKIQVPSRIEAPSDLEKVNESVEGKKDGCILGVNSNMEYSTDLNTWKYCTGTTISNLTDGTYYVRYKAVAGTSFASRVATVLITKGATKKIALTVTAPHFNEVTEGYTKRPEAKSVTIEEDTAKGANWDATVENVTLSGTDADSFIISGSGFDWTVQPVDGLKANTDGTTKIYKAKINVVYDATDGVTSPATADVTFQVNPKSNTVTVNGGTGSDTYNKGAKVTATANEASKGYAFKEWTGIEGLALLDDTTSISKTIQFTMPESAVELTATYKDIGLPTAEITVGDSKWNIFRDTPIFGYFYKNAKEVTIKGTDAETSVAKIQYYLSDVKLKEVDVKAFAETKWITYEAPFLISKNSKKIIYAKVIDEAGNYVIVNSDGIVIYEDSAKDEDGFTHIKGVDGAQTAKVTLNGNTVKSINDGSKMLSVDTDYMVATDGTITFTKSYLESLTASDTAYTMTVNYNPMGETGTMSEDSETPATTSLAIMVRKPKLISITAPKEITGVANGTDKTVAALGLPEKVTIVTEDTSIKTADVSWNFDNLASGSYDKEVLTEQTFTVNGTVEIPSTIDADKKTLMTSVQVTVNAADVVAEVAASLAAGTYTSNQNVTLSSTTGGANIYYTTNGSTPSKTNGTKYNGAISVTGTEGSEVTTTIKAIAVKGGMRDSEVTSFTYIIDIEDTTAPTAEITVGDSKWNTFRDTPIFGYFYKNAKEVTIKGTDAETSVAKIQYYLSDTELTAEQADELIETKWITYEAPFLISKNSKKIIYAKVIDEAGNYVIVNSDGIVIYEDSAKDEDGFTHIKGVDGAQTAKVILNGNTVKSINDGSKMLSVDTDYTVATDGMITFTKSYLESLTASDTAYTMTVSYNPMGETETKLEDSETPATTSLAIMVRKPKLISITAPKEITGVANGTDKTVAALGLPDKVTIVTEDTSIKTADVSWNFDNLASGSYDKTVLTEQTFSVNGTIILPTSIDADKKPLTITVQVTVNAADVVVTPKTIIETIKLTGIQLNKTSLVLAEDATATLKATLSPSTATNKKVIWKSSNAQVAKVSSTGKVIAVAPGNATITCTSEDGSNISVSCSVRVKEATSKKQELNVSVKTKDNRITVKWFKMEDVDGYYIYGAKCGSKLKKIKTIKKASTTNWTQKNLQKGEIYKYVVKGYKKYSKETKIVVSSIELHIATNSSEYTNAERVKTNFSMASLTKGKTKQIKASIVKHNKKKMLVDHVAKFRYLSSNKKVATVSEKGKLQATGAGTCYVYVYANNGVSKRIKITVR